MRRFGTTIHAVIDSFPPDLHDTVRRLTHSQAELAGAQNRTEDKLQLLADEVREGFRKVNEQFSALGSHWGLQTESALRTDLTEVEVSIRKSGREALLWLYAVAYLFLRNVRELVGRESVVVGKHPVLEPVRTREYQLLQFRLGEDCFGNTLKALRADHRQAYHCWTKVGSQTDPQRLLVEVRLAGLHRMPSPT